MVSTPFRSNAIWKYRDLSTQASTSARWWRFRLVTFEDHLGYRLSAPPCQATSSTFLCGHWPLMSLCCKPSNPVQMRPNGTYTDSKFHPEQNNRIIGPYAGFCIDCLTDDRPHVNDDRFRGRLIKATYVYSCLGQSREMTGIFWRQPWLSKNRILGSGRIKLSTVVLERSCSLLV